MEIQTQNGVKNVASICLPGIVMDAKFVRHVEEKVRENRITIKDDFVCLIFK